MIEGPPEAGEAGRPWTMRLAWFVGLAVASAVTCAAVAYALRALLFSA